MARTRIIIGNVNKTTTKLLYHGPSGSAAEATMKADTTCQSFEIFEGPGRRKNNPNYKAGDEAVAEVKAEPLKPLIPVEISDGEDKITISVQTEEEANALKALVQWLKESANTVNALRADSEADKAQKAQLLTEIETLQEKLKATPLTPVNEVKEVQTTTTAETLTTPPTAPKTAKK